MNSQRTEHILSSLKDFQRDTVDYAFARMYEDPSPSTRYLIADEVGLGKTKVAAGIVARAIDLLRAQDSTRRVDIIYICSNAGIARQNINRLNVTDQPCHDLPDRITLLPRDINRLRKNTVNFIAFTPGTSLSIRSSGGKAEERALLYWLLPDEWTENKRGVLSLLTGGMRRERFTGKVKDLPQRYGVDEALKSAFQCALTRDTKSLELPVAPLRERFLSLANQIGGRSALSDAERRERTAIVGELRSTLAEVCVESLEPDLVILDEFQRFSDLLHGDDDASRLARRLFAYRDERVAQGDVRVLLLSATPYRMFTSADEPGGDGHYADLIQTIRFLQNDPARTRAFQAALATYGRELFRIGQDDGAALRQARNEVASVLRRVMVRTERLAATADRSGMLKEVVCGEVRVTERDLDSFLALQDLARLVGVADVTEYWKSAPYLVNFMDDYDLKRRLEEVLMERVVPPGVLAALSGDGGTLLSRKDVSDYCELDPGNARLRQLMHDMLDSEAWRLLWMPPSWQYYTPEGEFANPAARSLTKRLIFSSWQVVPKAVAALVTYEAERRMLGVGPEGDPGSQTPEARRRRRGLLRFSVADGRTTGMPVLGLMYPSFVLAAEADPRAWSGSIERSPPPTLAEVITRARDVCARFLEEMTSEAPATGDMDERWYWAAPMLFDLRRDATSAKAWLGQANLAARWRGEETTQSDDDAAGEDAWAVHVRDARAMASNSAGLGRPPADLADVLALTAVAGPAVTALRALARVSGGLQRVTDTSLRNHAGHVAEGFRSLFNQPEVMVMLRRVNNAEPYWQRVLEYGARGGLQAVLDEYAHVLAEHLGVSGRPPAQIEQAVGTAMCEALTLRTATVTADSVDLDATGELAARVEKMGFRTRFAVRYGGRSREDTQTVLRQGDVQKAFNSPFWPFVLCSTSVGQEGLDFHLYCHALMHWNLPSNPVDLEQREGRIHRYKGHAVRKNVALAFSAGAGYAASGVESDSWHQLFESARSARGGETSDLEPFWVYTTEGGAHIERHLPMIPLSKDVERANGLRRSLAVYRMAFGQSRQDDLVQYLKRYLTPEQITASSEELRIDLTPTSSPHRDRSGVPQVPGDLAPGDIDADVGPSSVGLGDLQDLLDTFATVRPVAKVVSVDELKRFIDDFVALRDG